MYPSKDIRVFDTFFYEESLKNPYNDPLDNAKIEANIQWSQCENYLWVWDNAIKDSVTFHSGYNVASLEYRVVVTAQFKPEDLTYYLIRYGEV